MKAAKKFQSRVVADVLEYFEAAAARAPRPGAESEVTWAAGREPCAVLLEAPTGVGKTFMASLIIGRFSRNRKVLWFWFSPWEHLAEQTAAALIQEAHGLRVADLSEERLATALGGSRAYSLVWASLAAKVDVKRTTRMADDGKQGLDEFLAAARSRGYQIGVVVDEAHHGAGASTEAARLLKGTFKPDYALFVTATPDDEELAMLRAHLGIQRNRRVSVSRAEGVAAGLIKPDINVVYLNEASDTAGYLSAGAPLEQAVIAEAVRLHERQKLALSKLEGVSITPLLLVQVSSASKDAEEDARAALIAAGMPAGAIRTHTVNKPDKALQQIANDQSVEALIFKMAVATGFDAPRAFTLVSMRSARSERFGLQVLGRILRVHPQLRAFPKLPDELKLGHAFLVDSGAQSGLAAAGARINSIQAQVSEVCSSNTVVCDPSGNPLATWHTYSRLPELGPSALVTQYILQGPAEEANLEKRLAQAVKIDRTFLEAALRDSVTYHTQEHSVFDESAAPVPLENTVVKLDLPTIARRALRVLGAISDANLQALVKQLRGRMKAEFRAAELGEVSEQRLLHAVYLLSQVDPNNPVTEALALLRERSTSSRLAAPLPEAFEALIPLAPSARNLYGCIPDDLDSEEELSFIKNKLEDPDAPLVWWHRNPPRKPYSVGLAKVSGDMFYPDFLVGLNAAAGTPDIVLLEVKGEGWLDSKKVVEAFDAEHPVYGKAHFVVEQKGIWYFARKQDAEALELGDRFTWKELRRRVERAVSDRRD